MDEAKIKSICRIAGKKAEDLSEFFADVQRSLVLKSIHTSLNPLFLMDACESCYIDLERHKDFHGLDIADRHKRAAFLFKWLARKRPINLSAYKQGPGAGLAIHVNAYFALMAALGELDINVHKFAPTKISQNIIYAASYRDINAESWALTFCLLEKVFPI